MRADQLLLLTYLCVCQVLHEAHTLQCVARVEHVMVSHHVLLAYERATIRISHETNALILEAHCLRTIIRIAPASVAMHGHY